MFSDMGHELTLVIPKRKNTITQSLGEYYAFEPTFSILHIRSTPVIFNRLLGKITFRLEGFVFAVRSLFLQIPKDALIFTRSPEVAFLHAVFRRKVALEIHDWPDASLYVYKWMIRRVPFLIVTSQGLAEELQQSDMDNYLVAPNAVGKEFFVQTTIDSVIQKSKYGISEDKFIIMYVGSLAYWKGVVTLLESSKLLNSSEYQVVIAGGTEIEVTKLATDYPHVKFIGRLPNELLPTFQKLADVLIVPNRNDSAMSAKYTSPIKLFAHMTSSRPIIAADLPSIRNIVSDQEIFFFAGTANDLAQKIEFAHNNPTIAKQKADQAYASIINCTWEDRVQKIIEFTSQTQA